MHSISAPTPLQGTATAATRLAWPVGAEETRLPAKPMRPLDTPALLWRSLVRRTWWRLQRRIAPQPLPRPLWC